MARDSEVSKPRRSYRTHRFRERQIIGKKAIKCYNKYYQWDKRIHSEKRSVCLVRCDARCEKNKPAAVSLPYFVTGANSRESCFLGPGWEWPPVAVANIEEKNYLCFLRVSGWAWQLTLIKSLTGEKHIYSLNISFTWFRIPPKEMKTQRRGKT